MIQFILICLAVTAFGIILAYLLIKRRKMALALLVGLVIIGAHQVYLRLSFEASIHDCLERSCTLAGLPPDCNRIEFGCTEWSGLTIFVYTVTVIGQLIIFAIGYGLMVFLASRNKSMTAQKPEAP